MKSLILTLLISAAACLTCAGEMYGGGSDGQLTIGFKVDLLDVLETVQDYEPSTAYVEELIDPWGVGSAGDVLANAGAVTDSSVVSTNEVPIEEGIIVRSTKATTEHVKRNKWAYILGLLSTVALDAAGEIDWYGFAGDDNTPAATDESVPGITVRGDSNEITLKGDTPDRVTVEGDGNRFQFEVSE